MSKKYIVVNAMERSEISDYYLLCKDRLVPCIEIRKKGEYSMVSCDHPWLELTSYRNEEINGKVEQVQNPLGIQLAQLVERCFDGLTVSSFSGEGGFIDNVPTENVEKVAEELWDIYMSDWREKTR